MPLGEPEVIERVAALDVGKAEVVCCVGVPGPGGQRMQEVRSISTMTAAVRALGDWLAGLGMTRVVMGGDQRLLVPAVLPAGGPPPNLVGQRPRCQALARPAQDRPVECGLAVQGAERQMLRPSFVPPPAIRELRAGSGADALEDGHLEFLRFSDQGRFERRARRVSEGGRGGSRS